MPYTCIVLNCRSNYSSGGPRASVFGFPKEPELKQKWINAINRENFVPSKTSKVCEIHFNPVDIQRIQSATDPKTGRFLWCRLGTPRLQPDAIPSQNLNIPKLERLPSKKADSNIEKAKKSKKNEKLTVAIYKTKTQLLKRKKEQRKKMQDRIKSLSEIRRKLRLPKHWRFLAMHDKNEITIGRIINSENFGPQIKSAITIQEDLTLNAYKDSAKLTHVKERNLPLTVRSITTIKQLCEALSR